MPPVKVLSRGDCIRPGCYTVRTRYARSVLLLDAGGHPLFAVDRSIGPGPLNLVVDDPAAHVPDDHLLVPRRDPAPRFPSALPRPNRERIRRLHAVLRAALPRLAPPDSLISLFSPSPTPLPRFQQARDAAFHKAFARLAAGHLPAGVRLLRGCGTGLTPSGDDFLCGWMLACRLRHNTPLARKILPLALGGNPVSNAFLELSADGRVNVAVQRLVQAPSLPRAKTVCAFGHTSGADLLCGLRWGLDCPLILNPEP